MDLEPLSVLWPLGLATVSALVWIVTWRNAAPDLRMPLIFYAGIYGITTLVGATLIGLYGIPLIDSLNWELDVGTLLDLDSFTYWGILFSPMVFVPFCSLLLSTRLLGRAKARPACPPRGGKVSLIALVVVFASASGYCCFALFQNGYLQIENWFRIEGDYQSQILMRTEILDSFQARFFGIIYNLLPGLTYCAVHQCVRRPSAAWYATLAGFSLVTATLSLATMQKSIVLLFLLMLAVGLVELKVLRWKTFAVAALGLFIALTAMQVWLLPWEWRVIDTVKLIMFRLGSSYPYYLNIYPRWQPHLGVDLGLSLLGLASRPDNYRVVNDFMYPSITWVQGAATAPAHVCAYAEGGPVYALLMSPFIALFVTAASLLRQDLRSPFRFAFYMQMLISLYNLANMSLVDTLFSSYGMMWTALGLVPIWLLAKFFDRHKLESNAPPWQGRASPMPRFVIPTRATGQ
jgi:hypothetical protein